MVDKERDDDSGKVPQPTPGAKGTATVYAPPTVPHADSTPTPTPAPTPGKKGVATVYAAPTSPQQSNPVSGSTGSQNPNDTSYQARQQQAQDQANTYYKERGLNPTQDQLNQKVSDYARSLEINGKLTPGTPEYDQALGNYLKANNLQLVPSTPNPKETSPPDYGKDNYGYTKDVKVSDVVKKGFTQNTSDIMSSDLGETIQNKPPSKAQQDLITAQAMKETFSGLSTGQPAQRKGIDVKLTQGTRESQAQLDQAASNAYDKASRLYGNNYFGSDDRTAIGSLAGKKVISNPNGAGLLIVPEKTLPENHIPLGNELIQPQQVKPQAKSPTAYTVGLYENEGVSEGLGAGTSNVQSFVNDLVKQAKGDAAKTIDVLEITTYSTEGVTATKTHLLESVPIEKAQQELPVIVEKYANNPNVVYSHQNNAAHPMVGATLENPNLESISKQTTKLLIPETNYPLPTELVNPVMEIKDTIKSMGISLAATVESLPYAYSKLVKDISSGTYAKNEKAPGFPAVLVPQFVMSPEAQSFVSSNVPPLPNLFNPLLGKEFGASGRSKQYDIISLGIQAAMLVPPKEVFPIRVGAKMILGEGIGQVPVSKALPNVMTEGPKVISISPKVVLGYEGKYSIAIGAVSSEGEKYPVTRLRPQDIKPTLEHLTPYSERGPEYAGLSKLTQEKLLTPQGGKVQADMGKVKEKEFNDLVVQGKEYAKASESLKDVKLNKEEVTQAFNQMELTGNPEVNQGIKETLITVSSRKASLKASIEAKQVGNKELASAFISFTKEPFPGAKGSTINILEINKYNQELATNELSTKTLSGQRVPVNSIEDIGDIDYDLKKETQSKNLLTVLQGKVKVPEGYGFGKSGLNIVYGKGTEPIFPKIGLGKNEVLHGTSKPSATNIINNGINPQASKRSQGLFAFTKQEGAKAYAIKTALEENAKPAMIKLELNQGNILKMKDLTKSERKLVIPNEEQIAKEGGPAFFWSALQKNLIAYGKKHGYAGVQKPYKTSTLNAKQQEVIIFEKSAVKSMEEINPTGYETQEGKKVLNLLGKEDELNSELSKLSTGKVYRREFPHKEISHGGFKTLTIEFQAKALLKSITSAQSKKTLSEFEGSTTPEIVKGTMERFKQPGKSDVETIITTPYIRTKDVIREYGIGKYGEKTLIGFFNKKAGKKMGEYADLLKQYHPYLDWEAIENEQAYQRFVSKPSQPIKTSLENKIPARLTSQPYNRNNENEKKKSLRSASRPNKQSSLISISRRNISQRSMKSITSPTSPKSPASPSLVSPKSPTSPTSPRSPKSPTSPTSPLSPKSPASPTSPKSSASPSFKTPPTSTVKQNIIPLTIDIRNKTDKGVPLRPKPRADFLGNSSELQVVGLYNRIETVYGLKRIGKLTRKDYSKMTKGIPKFTTSKANTLVSSNRKIRF